MLEVYVSEETRRFVVLGWGWFGSGGSSGAGTRAQRDVLAQRVLEKGAPGAGRGRASGWMELVGPHSSAPALGWGLDARGWHDAGVMAQCRGNGNAARGQEHQVKGAG